MCSCDKGVGIGIGIDIDMRSANLDGFARMISVGPSASCNLLSSSACSSYMKNRDRRDRLIVRDAGNRFVVDRRVLGDQPRESRAHRFVNSLRKIRGTVCTIDNGAMGY